MDLHVCGYVYFTLLTRRLRSRLLLHFVQRAVYTHSHARLLVTVTVHGWIWLHGWTLVDYTGAVYVTFTTPGYYRPVGPLVPLLITRFGCTCCIARYSHVVGTTRTLLITLLLLLKIWTVNRWTRCPGPVVDLLNAIGPLYITGQRYLRYGVGRWCSCCASQLVVTVVALF